MNIFSTAPVWLFIHGSMVPMPGPLDPTGGDQWTRAIFSDNIQNYKIMASTFCSEMLANNTAQRNREILWKL